jgi:hypothetical protein
MGRKRGHAPIAALALGLVLACATVSTASAGQRATTQHNPAPPSTGLLRVFGALNGVAATHGVAWAVGYSGTLGSPSALTVYWNGHRWQRRANPGPPDTELTAVTATSPTNAWAVGTVGIEPNPTKTLILHWNGKKWVGMPGIPGTLSAVAASSPTNAWAVGESSDGAALVLHWNGKKWQRTPSPAGMLNGVATTSPTSAWAVGGTGASQATLILHWNGETWQQITSPSMGGDQGLGSILLGVEASADRPVLAVGDGDDCGCGPGNPLVARWNGQVWSQDPTSAIQGMDLWGVAALPTGGAWAVGESGSGDSATNGVILRSKGSAWAVEPVSGLASQVGGLSGIAAASGTSAWAVGWESPVTVASANASGQPGDPGPHGILILHWNGSKWTPQTKLASAPTGAATLPTTTSTTFAPPTTSSTTVAPSTTTTTPATTTSPSTSASASGGPLLGSAAWGQALGSYGGISGFGEVAPTEITLSEIAGGGLQVSSISWSNWGAAEATGQGQSIDGTGQTGPISSWPLKPVTVVAFDLGSCNGGPPAYGEVEWYFPGDGGTFDPSKATNACTGD